MREIVKQPPRVDDLLEGISKLDDAERAKYILGSWDILKELGARKIVKTVFENNIPSDLNTDHCFNTFVRTVKAAYAPWSLAKGYYRMCEILLEIGEVNRRYRNKIIERLTNPFPLYERKYIEKRSSVLNVIKRYIEGYITSSSNKNNVVAVVVYGSYSRNNFVWDSDLDIDVVYRKRTYNIPEARVEADLAKFVKEIRRLFAEKFDPNNAPSVDASIEIQKTGDYTMSTDSLQTFTEEIQTSTAKNKHYIVISPYDDVKKKIGSLFVKKAKNG